MSLLTTDRYRAITGDDAADATVSALIEDAVAKLEEDLGRPLEAVERIEQVWPDRRGYLYPLATPITEAEGWTVEGNALRAGSWPLSASWPATVDYVSVTYTGGYVERTANPDATNRLPICMERDLAWAAYALGHPTQLASQLPAGASSVSVGDISVSFGGGGTMRSGDDLAIRWSRSTLRYRRRGL
jgi:hypothetical protein